MRTLRFQQPDGYKEWLSLLVWMALWLLIGANAGGWRGPLSAGWEIASWRWEEIKIGAALKRSITQAALRNYIVISSTLVLLQIRPLLHNAINLSARAGERHTKEIVPFYDSLSSIEMNCAPRIVIVWRDIFCNFSNTGAFTSLKFSACIYC
jgi:hypothetical protein